MIRAPSSPAARPPVRTVFRVFTSLLAFVSIAADAAAAPSPAKAGAALMDIQILSWEASETVAFITSGEAEYALQQQVSPPRVVVELPSVRPRLRSRTLPAGLKLIGSLQVSEMGRGRERGTRVELGLRQPVQVDVTRSPGVVMLTLRPGPPRPGPVGIADAIEARPDSAGESPTPAAAAQEPARATATEEAVPAEPAAMPAPSGAGEETAPAPSGRSEAPVAAPLAPGNSDVPLGPQDLLEVKVFGVDALDRRVRVAADGTVTLPLVGSLAAAGLTRAALEQEIARRLGDGYVKDPQVSVFIQEYRSRRVAVNGAVRQPGAFEILRPTTLLEVLALAGGVLPEEAAGRVQIVRPGPDGEARTLEVDRFSLERGRLDANLAIQPGDLINVPYEETIEVLVQGQVARPDRYRARRSEPPTVLQVVMQAGGPAAGASGRRVEIVRRSGEGGTRTLVVNLNRIREGKDPDLPLQDSDIIVVH